MYEDAPAGFLRGLGSFTIDAALLTAMYVATIAAWAISSAGVLPDTPSHLDTVYAASLESDPNLFPLTCLGYLVACWTPVFGRRSVGMRFTGLRMVRSPALEVPASGLAGKQNGRRITPAAVVRTSVEEDKSYEYVPRQIR